MCLFLFKVSEFEILGLRSLTREDDSRCREEGRKEKCDKGNLFCKR